MGEFVWTADKVSVEFPGVKALDAVDFEVKAGEICAVAGANGAGKSTFVKVLCGICRSYTGEIRCNGQKVSLGSPADAAKLGIHMVYQEVDEAILPDFTVAENLLMPDLALGRGIIYRRKKIFKDAANILSEFHLEIAPDRMGEKLSLSEKQLLLIAKAVHQECRLLILDEPTAALSRKETERLFETIRFLAKEKGSAVIFISHRIPEILEICEKCTVMRDGRIAAEFAITPETKQEEITGAMFGHPPVPAAGGDTQKSSFKRTGEQTEDCPFFEVRDITDSHDKFHNISFYAKAGEVVGLAGLTGAGKTEICKALFGARTIKSGEIRMGGKRVTIRNPADAVKNGIALVPEQRRSEGIFPTMETSFNLGVAALPAFCRFGFWQKKKMAGQMDAYIQKNKITCSSGKQEIRYLSGGNQQKAVIGRWMAAKSRLYMLDEPMQGVDIGAKRELFDLIRTLAQEGRAVIYASSDISELLAVTDRIYVLSRGGITTEFRTMDVNEQELMQQILEVSQDG